MSIYSRYADTFPKVYNSEKLASRIPGKERIVFHHEFSEPFAVSFFSGIELGLSHSLLGDSSNPRGKRKIWNDMKWWWMRKNSLFGRGWCLKEPFIVTPCNALYLSYSIWSRWTLKMWAEIGAGIACCLARRTPDVAQHGSGVVNGGSPWALRRTVNWHPLNGNHGRQPPAGKVPSMPCMPMYGRSMPCRRFLAGLAPIIFSL